MKNKQKQLKTKEKNKLILKKNVKPNIEESANKNVIPQDVLNDEAKNKLNQIKEIEKTLDRENLVYRASEYPYSFKNFQTKRTFGKDI